LRQSHKVDMIIDGRKITSKVNDIELKIDDVKVYSTKHRYNHKKSSKDFTWTSIKSFLNASDSAFSHIDRFRIVRSLSESPKTFTEIKQLLNATSATANFHLKTLINGMIVYKDKDGKYALSLLGELVLDYFSTFLEEANRLQKTINK